jgi:mono/diheme cytochrome c family protein
LSENYPDQETASESFDSLDKFYAENYPEIHAERQLDILVAIDTLRDINDQIRFPEQSLNWETHPDNLGHKDDLGCFRCHDGKHLSGTGEAIRLECNLCHSIPVVTDNTGLTTEIELGRGPEPPSHTHTSWITLHGKAIDSSCAACHVPEDPGVDYTDLEGKPPADASFCGNSACHVSEWEYTGFDSPELEPYLERQLYELQNTSPYLLEGVPQTYEATFKTLFEGRCIFCHSGQVAEADLDLSTYAGLLQGGKSGPALVPGDPDGSPIVQRQSGSRDHFGQMLDDELEALQQWIADGAPEG